VGFKKKRVDFLGRIFIQQLCCEVTWSSVKSFSDLYKQKQALLLSPVFFVPGLQ